MFPKFTTKALIHGILLCIAIVTMNISTDAQAQSSSTVTCNGLPGTYVKLINQPYALCAGAQSVNYDEITYAKCTKMSGTSISAPETFPFPSNGAFNKINNSGNIADLNLGAPNAGGYMVSTYSPPAGVMNSSNSLALYTCNEGGSYAQCDGGLCFTSTSGPNKSSALWGNVSDQEIICSCPITTTKNSFQVFGPGKCPRTKADYDAVCAANVSHINNGAILYIGAPTGSPELLAQCLSHSTQIFNKCDRPSK